MAKAEEEEGREKLTLSAAIHKIQLALLDDGPCTERELFAAGGLLSRPDYEDVVVERSIVGLCGHPTCPNPLPADRPRRGRYRISLSEHKVYDLEETYKFCSDACVVGSRAFSGSLQPDRCLSTEPGRLEQLFRLFEDLLSQRRPDRRRRRRRWPKKVAVEDGDFGFSKLTIHEKSGLAPGEVSAEEWIGPSNAIEGYVPQRERHHGPDGKRKGRSTSKSKPKPGKGTLDTDEKTLEFKSGIIIGEPFSIAPAPSSSEFTPSSSALGVPGANDGALVEKFEMSEKRQSEKSPEKRQSEKSPEKRQSEKSPEKRQLEAPPAMKSSLRSSGAKSRNRTVRWVDEEKLGSSDETVHSVAREVSGTAGGSSTETREEKDDDRSQRLASAEACVAALVEAAETVASGELESVDAPGEVGIVILPPAAYSEERNVEADEDAFEIDQGLVKWPKKTVLLDTDMFEVEDSWHDTPPAGFSLTLSAFATMWNALFGWITCSSLAFVYGRVESSAEDFLTVNGREYPRKIVLPDGRSSEIKQTMAGCLARALPQLVTDLHLQAPVSTIEKAMVQLLETMSFLDALPAFKIKQWRVVVLLFVDALSVHRLPAVTPQMAGSRPLLTKVLDAAQVSWDEYESMKELILPLGRVPQFSVRSAG